MTKKSNILIAVTTLSILAFIYLSFHHFSLKAGLTGGSLCSVSSSVNCDAAANSNYSELFGLPVAVLGAFFQFIILTFLLGLKMGFVEQTPYVKNTLRFQLLFAAGVSIIMATISVLFVKVACPFCIATYVLSFAALYLGWNVVHESKEQFVLTGYLGAYKSHLIALALVPFFSWVATGMALKHYGLDEIQKYVPEKIAIWQNSAVNNFDPQIGIDNKTENPKFTLVEFADFKCPHCKSASKTIELFLSTRNDVRFIFKPFPLDGNCNPNVQRKGDNSRCVMAAAALCAEKLSAKGLDVTHWLFKNQEDFMEVSDGKSLLPQISNLFSIEQGALESCVDSTEIYETIAKSSQEALAANVEGTPTIYLNGKKLPWGQVLELLKAATK